MEITIAWEAVEKEAKGIVRSLRKRVRIPGFRPGKAPDAVIKTRYRDEIRQEVLEDLAPRFFGEQVKEKGLKVAGEPKMTGLHFEDGEALRFTAHFDVFPEFELGDYHRIEAPYSEPEVTADDVDEELDRLRGQHASFRNLDPRPLADGDIAVLSLKSDTADGGPTIDRDETTLTIGDKQTLPEFNENLRGKSPGDEVDFQVSYPDDYGSSDLAGKAVRFHAVIKGLREKELPELDDDFASEVGEFQTLDELKSRIREEIENFRRRESQEAARQVIIDKLLEAHDFPAPESMVERQIRTRLERRAREIAGQGIDIEKLDLDWSKLRDVERDGAVRDVRAGLLLDRIALAESITANSEEIDQQVQQYAQQRQLTPAAARDKLANDGSLDRIGNQLRNQKTLAFLFDEAQKVDQQDKED